MSAAGGPEPRAAGARAGGPPRPMRTRDLLAEALAGLLARPAARRAHRARHRHRRRRARRHARPLEDGGQPDRRALRRARRRPTSSSARRPAPAAPAAAVLPWDAEARLRRLNGVVAAGTLADVDVRGELVRSVPINDPLAAGRDPAADQGRLARPVPGRAGRSCSAGRLFDAGHSRRGRPRRSSSAPNAARRVGITRVDQQPADLHRRPPLRRHRPARRRRAGRPRCSAAAIMPEGTARREFGLRGARARPRSRRASAPSTSSPARRPLALSPADPDLLKVAAPPDPRRLRGAVQERPQRALPAARRRVAARRRDRHRQRHARLRARARRRDRPAPRARRRPPPHRRAVPAREHRDGPRRRRRRRERSGRSSSSPCPPANTWTPVLDPWVPLGAPLLGARHRPAVRHLPVAARRRRSSPSRRCAPAPETTIGHGGSRCALDPPAPAPARRRPSPPARAPSLALAGCGGDSGGGGPSAAATSSSAPAKPKPVDRRAVEDQLGFDQAGIMARQSRVEAAIRDCMKAQGFDYVPVDPFAQRAARDRREPPQRRGLPQAVRLRHQHAVGPRQPAGRPQPALRASLGPADRARLRPRAVGREPGRDVRRGGRQRRLHEARRAARGRPPRRSSAARRSSRSCRASSTSSTTASSRTSAWSGRSRSWSRVHGRGGLPLRGPGRDRRRPVTKRMEQIVGPLPGQFATGPPAGEQRAALRPRGADGAPARRGRDRARADYACERQATSRPSSRSSARSTRRSSARGTENLIGQVKPVR